jgi:type II secretory pathway component PulF
MVAEAEVRTTTTSPGRQRIARVSENTSKRPQAWLVVLLLLHAVCGVFIVWLLLKLVPQCEKIFGDFNMKLPDMTILAISLSRLFGRYWFVLVPGLAAADIAIMVSLNRTGHARLMTVWGVLIWLAEILLAGMIQMVVIVPLNDLITNLSGGK